MGLCPWSVTPAGLSSSADRPRPVISLAPTYKETEGEELERMVKKQFPAVASRSSEAIFENLERVSQSSKRMLEKLERI